MSTPLLSGDTLRQWREQNDLTQDRMGELLGVSREWIGKIERGEREVSAEVYLKFCDLRRDPRFTSSQSLDEEMKPLYEAAQVAEDADPVRRQIKDDIRAHVERAITAADNRPHLLSWLLVEMEHLLTALGRRLHEEGVVVPISTRPKRTKEELREARRLLDKLHEPEQTPEQKRGPAVGS